MTEEQYDKFKSDNKVSTLSAWTGDYVQDLMEEVFYEGYCAGYESAIRRLRITGPSSLGCNFKKFFDENMPTIHAHLNAIREIEAEEKE